MTMNFARNFTALRKRNNITQEQMAEKCGVSRAAIAKWEAGNSIPNLYMVDDISKIFEVTVDELLHGKMEDASTVIDIDYASEMNEKIDKMKAEIISEIRKKDNNFDAYAEYCQIQNQGIYDNIPDDDVPVEAYTYWGCEAAEKGNYTEALKYLEEAVVRGDINSAFTVLNIYEDIVDGYACAEDMSGILETRLTQAKKMQQYGKIIESVIASGNAF